MHMPKAITALENIYTNFKSVAFGKQFLKCHSYVADIVQYKHSKNNYTQNITLQRMAQKFKDKTRQ